MTAEGRRLANIAAEEGDWRSLAKLPAVQTTAALWAELFVPEPVFDWIDAECFHAWLNTEEAATASAVCGLALAGADPRATRQVHDKAFAVRAAQAGRLGAASLLSCIDVWEPEALLAPDAQVRLEACIDSWPAEFGGRFTLKPRLGSSGRGRVSQLSAVAGALLRLAARGGAVLEPWLERTQDLSAQLFLGSGSGLILLGTLEGVYTSSGLFRGHRGWIDARGRVSSGSAYDGALRDAAVEIADAARSAGYQGPCGLDAFVYRLDDQEQLRPVVEWNARYTTGTVVLGQLRRRLATLRREDGLSATCPLAFYFGLDPPPNGWPDPGSAARCYRLTGGRAALLVAPTRADIDAVLDRVDPA